MALPWHIPLESLPSLKEKEGPIETSQLKHYCNLNIHENPCEELQTGIMCEIGMNNREPGVIQRLIASGMTVARLNLRDLEPDSCAHLIQSIRQAVYNYSAELEYVYPLALIVDVRGPDIVTGDLKGGPKTMVELLQQETIRLTTDPSWRECGTTDCLYVGYDHLTDLQPNDILFIDSLTSGKIKLVILAVGDDSIECEIAIGGTIGAKMPVRLSKVPQENDSSYKKGHENIESVSCDSSQQPFEYMEDQIAWAVASDIDGVLIPNSQNAQDIRHVRSILFKKGKHILVFACIDSVIGLDNIDQLVTEADGIFIDRCILSTDLPVEKIFIAQKIIVSKCNNAGKPCICKAVINEQIPTLCVTDIANLVLDGADVLSLELHYDSPLKKISPSYDAVRMAEHCVAAASVICRQAERILWQPKIYGNLELMQSPLEEPTKAICVSAVELATRSRSVVIICLTNSGRTAKLISHAKPVCPIVAVTRTCHTARQLRFWRGVRAMHYFESAKSSWILEMESRIHAALDYCKAKRILRAGDAYVVVTSLRRGVGYCDSAQTGHLFLDIQSVRQLQLNLIVKITLFGISPSIYITLVKEFKVNCLDSIGRSWILGYGSCSIPSAPGQHIIQVPCWVPAATTVTDKLRQIFIGGTHQLTQTDIVNLGSDRFKLNTLSKGNIELKVYIILRNFNQFGVEYK
ncbi:pyruvate kinase-like isoform X2 [Maniola hyperantus]|uniref:pyruvate kinase-like isoform X2 n=1 Tax=Aphantopus hyperantus TaxID=2795564 RepID=UPI003747F794